MKPVPYSHTAGTTDKADIPREFLPAGLILGDDVQITSTQALAHRMSSLLLDGQSSPTAAVPDVASVVTWFGAMQSQDLGSGLWSFGARLPHLNLTDICAALERREALRTWPMRGTVHFVPPRDARWMLELMGVRALAGAARRREHLGLSAVLAERAVEVLGTALAGGGRMTRAECVATLRAAGINADGQLAYHLLWYASQQGVTCIAPNIGSEQTFVLLSEYVPDPHLPERDEALATMALRYFRSHGPSTVKDFVGWTGLTSADCKRGIAAAGESLVSVDVEGTPMVEFSNEADRRATASEPDPDAVIAVSGFDEYLLGFKDRSLMLAAEHKQAIIPGSNGIFMWTIVRGGRVIGTWKRSPKTAKTVVDVLPLITLRAKDRKAVEAAFLPYQRFLGRPVEVRWPS